MFEGLEEAVVTIVCPRMASRGAGGSEPKKRLGPGIDPDDENRWFKAALERVRSEGRDRREVVSVRWGAGSCNGDRHSWGWP